MNTYLERFKTFAWSGKRKYGLLVLIFIVFGGVWYFSPKGKVDQNASLFVAKKITLIQEVTVTGNVKPANNVSLSFDASGRISGVYVSVGSRVLPGTLIASLSNGSLRADLDKAEAALSELKKGARAEDIAVSEADLAKAKQDLENYYDSVSDTLGSALLKGGDALTSQTDVLFSNANTSNALLNFSVSNFQNKVDAEQNRVYATQAQNKFTTLLATLSQSHTGKKDALISAREYLDVINNYLSIVYSAVNNATGLSAATQLTYKTDITAARTNVTSAITSINTLLQSIASQEITVTKNENALALKKAGPTQEELTRKEADVTSARAILGKTLIYSPIGGIVSTVIPKTGETVSAGAPLFEVISFGKFEIEVNVPEVDVAKITVGNSAKVTLDAYGEDVEFISHVSKIDPAEKIVDGVPTYKTTLLFDKEDSRIRSGMTANITIETNKKENIFAVPGRTIITKSGKKYVKILRNDGTEEEVPVTTGLRGSAGLVEIISGLNENDRIVTQTSGS